MSERLAHRMIRVCGSVVTVLVVVSLFVAPGRPVAASDQARVTPAAASYNAVPQARVWQVAQLPFAPRNWNGETATVAVQNTGSTSSGATLYFGGTNGANVATATLPTLAPGGSTLVRLDTVPGLPDGFDGGVTVTGDAGSRIAASVTIERTDGDTSAYEASNVAYGLSLPLLFKNYHGWNTFVQLSYLLCPGTFAVEYRERDTGKAWSENVTLSGSGVVRLDQEQSAVLPDGFVGSATVRLVSGGVPPHLYPMITAVVNEEKANYSMEYPGLVAGNATIFAPLLFKNYNGYNSGWQVQNLGTQDTWVNMTYTRVDDAGTWTTTAHVDPGASASFEQSKDPQLPDGAVFAALATSSNGQPLGGIVNELKYDLGQVMNYVGAAGGDSSLFAPYMTKGVDGWRTGIQMQNLSSEAAAMTLELLDPDGSVALKIQDDIAPSASRSYDLKDVSGIPAGWTGSARVRSDNGQPLAAIVNEVRQ